MLHLIAFIAGRIAWFRFHTGSIKRDAGMMLYQPFVPRFRFHTGSIKRESLKASIDEMFRFDSILVRLKAHVFTQKIGRGAVSIPYWFD